LHVNNIRLPVVILNKEFNSHCSVLVSFRNTFKFDLVTVNLKKIYKPNRKY